MGGLVSPVFKRVVSDEVAPLMDVMVIHHIMQVESAPWEEFEVKIGVDQVIGGAEFASVGMLTRNQNRQWIGPTLRENDNLCN